MCQEKEYYCPNPECGNMAFEPGLCSGCGATLEEVEMIGTEESLEGWPVSAGFAPRVTPECHQKGSEGKGGRVVLLNETGARADIDAATANKLIGHVNSGTMPPEKNREGIAPLTPEQKNGIMSLMADWPRKKE